MPGETQSLEVAPGVEIEVTNFTPEEEARFNADYPKVTAVYSQNSVRGDGKHIISDWFDETKATYKMLGQACKHDIQPSAGIFQGMRATTGFGMRMIRHDDILVAAQVNWDIALAALTNGNWYGLYHNAVIGAAYNATPLYLRKELGIGWVGMREHQPDPMAAEIQLELNGKPLPTFNMLQQMGSAIRPATVVTYVAATDSWGQGRQPSNDLKVFRFPSVEYLKPAIQYRSQFKATGAGLVNVWGRMCLTPLGLTFVTADYMRNTAPTRPATTAP